MNDHILNLITQLLCYSDPSVTDNPHERAFDHRRRLESIAVKNPSGDSKMLAPGEAFSIVQNVISSGLSGSSTVQITQVSAQDSVYRLAVTSGPDAFRTSRAPSGLDACSVTVNNGAVAVFDFAAADLSAVQVGDLMKINGDQSYDTGPFQFNPINSGIWKVIGVNGTKISATRPVGQPFLAVAEDVAHVGSDVSFFADDVIRPGMQFQISGTFSPVSQRTFEVLNSTPLYIDFVSTAAIPEETGLTYDPGSVVFYTGVKRMIYCECDQECAIRFNGQTDDLNRITPIEPGDATLRGNLIKWGDTYSCTVVNKSVNSCTIKFFTVE